MRPLGLSAPAEAAYRALLRHPGIGTLALRRFVSGTEEQLTEVLAGLQGIGLVSRGGGDAVGWLAATPEVAVELLLMKRQAELNEARRIVPDLQKDLLRDTSATSTTDVQVLSADAHAQLQAYLQLFEQATRSVDSLVRPPFLASSPAAIEAVRDAARKRGVRIRSILSPEIMKWDGWQAAVQASVAAGDQVRVLDALPFKMVLADGTGAMVPLRADEPDGPALLLGDTAPVAALALLFDQLWDVAAPVADMTNAAAASDVTGVSTRPDAAGGDALLDELITVLASGANDKTAAQLLGISDRTLQRRIATSGLRLRAKSRFQFGWLAAKKRLGR